MRAAQQLLIQFLNLTFLIVFAFNITMVVKFQSDHSLESSSSPSSPKRPRWFSLMQPSSTPQPKGIEERYFSTNEYEYELSPREKGSCTISSDTDVVITERMIPTTKRVYLIRHAESEENRRLASLTKSLKGLGSLKLPTKDDVMASMELLNVRAQLDSDVSAVGKKQVSLWVSFYSQNSEL